MTAKPNRTRIHRVHNVIVSGTIDGGTWRFPLAEHREKLRVQIDGNPVDGAKMLSEGTEL